MHRAGLCVDVNHVMLIDAPTTVMSGRPLISALSSVPNV